MGVIDPQLEDMGWTPEEAAMMRRIDPVVRDRVLDLLARVDGDLGFLAVRALQVYCTCCSWNAPNPTHGAFDRLASGGQSRPYPFNDLG